MEDGNNVQENLFANLLVAKNISMAADKAELLPWLALNRLTACGSVSQHRLLHAAGGMAALCELSIGALKEILSGNPLQEWLEFCRYPARSSLLMAAQKDYDAAQAVNAQIVHAKSHYYPELLSQIHSAPIVLFVQGDVNCLHLPQLAVVGSRNASAGGLELAQEFSAALGKQGLAISSGLALGIDGAAHRGALSAAAKTIAVVATGLDQVYPRRHEKLAQDILLSGGALVSEFPPGTKPQPQNFPRRNRIISGLSLGVLVVEASLQSGSLITARYAMEQGREVFALPGSVRSVFHRGCHALIRQGATLVETTADIAEQLDGMLAFKKNECSVLAKFNNQSGEWSVDALRVYKVLDHTPVGLDGLAERSQLGIGVLTAALMDLEMEGVIVQQHGLYSRC